MFILLEEVVIPLDEQVLVFINRILFNSSYFKFTEVEVPIPTDWFGFILRFTISLLSKKCAVETDTCACILSNVPVTWVKLLSKEYSKLLDPTFVSPTNDKPFEVVVNPTCVTIPM